MSKLLVSTLIVSACLLLPASAFARTINICVKHDASFLDNGYGEYYWQTDKAREARGIHLRVRKGSTTYFDGPTGDGIGLFDPGKGCTGPITTSSLNGTWQFRIYSEGMVQGNNIEVRDRDTGVLRYTTEYRTLSWPSSVHSLTLGLTFSSVLGAEEFNVYQAAAFGLYRHAGGMTNKWYRYRVGTDGSGGSDDPGSQRNGNGKIWILPDGAQRKFLLIHEAGHRLAANRIGSKMSDHNPYNYASTLCDETTSGSHSINSQEWAGAALSEGYSQFYAADVWNTHADHGANCQFRYYKLMGGDRKTVDCEDNSANTAEFPGKYAENWPCDTPLDGTGVELDWMRFFWDFHTNPGYPKPTFTDILDLIDDADDWTKTTAFDKLDGEAQTFRSTVFRTRWNGTAAYNGVDH